jgi:DNA-binding MarR family transcriptional regulator
MANDHSKNDKTNGTNPNVGHSAPLTISRPELLIDGSDDQFRELVHGLFALTARHEAVRNGHADYIGLPGIQYTILIAIGHLEANGPVTVKMIADHLHVSGSFITLETGKLVRDGLITKTRRADDRRHVSLVLTDEGRQLLDRLAPRQRRVNDVQFDGLTRKEFDTLLDLVERLIESSDQARSLQKYLAETEESVMPRKEIFDSVATPT